MTSDELSELCISSTARWGKVDSTNGAPLGSPPQVFPHFPDNAVVGVNGEVGVVITRTTHHKCGRCWRHLPEVTEDGDLCSRCDQVVTAMDASA